MRTVAVHKLSAYVAMMAAIFPVILLAFAPEAYAQYFGRNKPRYEQFDFKVHQTPHFEIYHYLQDDTLAGQLARDTERWYRLHQQVFQDTFKTRNPVIFYANHADFQQTNAVGSLIGEGTGGVTEGLKNRVIMPLAESTAKTNHVLGHELVHAFQYHLFKTDSTSLNSLRNIPLWMIEGMAEYLSVGSVDPHTAMWMRDAVWQDDIPSLKDMTNKMYKYFPYRYGQAFWAFVAGVWGDDKVRELFLQTAKYGYAAAVDSVLDVDDVTLSGMWKTALKEHYEPYLNKADTTAAGTLLAAKEKGTRMNISPSLSPDGRYLAYLSEKDVFTLDLYLADAQTGEIIKKLSSEIKNDRVDGFNIFESSGTWSPFSNQFAFSVFSEGKNKLVIVDAAKAGKSREIDIPGIDAFSNPAWSPDGKTILVSGLVDGRNDLFLYDLPTEKVSRLTNDAYAEMQPTWSPDGRYIAFTTDRLAEGQQRDASAGSAYNLALLDTKTGKISVSEVFAGASNMNPVFGPEMQYIYFLSNRDGFRNLYQYEWATGKVYQLTDYFTGISGITPYSTALTVAQESGNMVYSLYHKNGYELYAATPDLFHAQEVDPFDLNFEAATLPPLKSVDERLVNSNLDSFYRQPTISVDSIREVPYRPKFQLDYISNTQVGVATGRFGTGLAGGVNALFGDMLGNQQLFAGIALNGEIYDFGGQLAYVNREKKLGWGAAISHIPYRSAGVGFVNDSIPYEGDTLDVTNLQMDLLRTFETQVSVFGFYPLSQTRRFEAGASFLHYGFRKDRYNNYYYQGILIDEDREKLPSPDGYNLQEVDVAYVVDNSQFGLASPMTGKRARFEVKRYFGEFDFYTALADYRKYFYMKPFSLGLRLMHYGRYGKDANSDRLYPFYIASPYFVRGYDSNATLNKLVENGNDLSFNHLAGSKMLVGNLELRLPFTGPEPMALIDSRFLFTELNLFLDGGMAWDTFGETAGTDEPEGRNFASARPVFSTGISARINLFGQLVIEPYYAIPLQKGGLSAGSFGLNFIPGW